MLRNLVLNIFDTFSTFIHHSADCINYLFYELSLPAGIDMNAECSVT